MKRLKKAILLPVRKISYRMKFLPLYYWADHQMFGLRSVHVMPIFYYHGLYHMSMWLNNHGAFIHLADRVIHTIPYNIRFDIA